VQAVVGSSLMLTAIPSLTATFAARNVRKQTSAKSSGNAGGDSQDRSVLIAAGNRAAITNSHGVFRVTVHLKTSSSQAVTISPKAGRLLPQIGCSLNLRLTARSAKVNTFTVERSTVKKPAKKRSKRFRLFLKYYDAGVNAYAAAIRAGYSEAMARGRSYQLARVAQRVLGWDDLPPSGRTLIRRHGPISRRVRSQMM